MHTRPARRPDQLPLRDSMQKGGRWVGDDDMLTHAGYPPSPLTQQPTWPTAHTAHSQHCGHTAVCGLGRTICVQQYCDSVGNTVG